MLKLAAVIISGGLMALPVAARTEVGGDIVAVAQSSSDPFSALVGKRRERRADRTTRVKIERYVIVSDERAFLFEDHSTEARIKFLCTPGDPRLDCMIDPEGPAAEIYQLTPTRGPRGDIIYKNSHGDTLLRIASYGGATVFWPGMAEGFAASKSFGDDAALALPFARYETVVRRAQNATAIISAITGAPIIFDTGAAPKWQDTNVAVLSDAVVLAAKGIREVANDPTGARIIANQIRAVAFVPAAAPGVGLKDDVLEISYVPDRDIEGRPSSVMVARFLEESL